jgi:hypothetical protein
MPTYRPLAFPMRGSPAQPAGCPAAESRTVT